MGAIQTRNTLQADVAEAELTFLEFSTNAIGCVGVSWSSSDEVNVPEKMVRLALSELDTT